MKNNFSSFFKKYSTSLLIIFCIWCAAVCMSVLTKEAFALSIITTIVLYEWLNKLFLAADKKSSDLHISISTSLLKEEESHRKAVKEFDKNFKEFKSGLAKIKEENK